MSDEKRTELNMIPDGEENLGSDDAETLSGKESRIAEESDFPVPETESEVSSESDGSKETITEESEDSDDAVVCESEGAENPVNALSDEDSDKESDSARFGSDENPDSGNSSASDENVKSVQYRLVDGHSCARRHLCDVVLRKSGLSRRLCDKRFVDDGQMG